MDLKDCLESSAEIIFSHKPGHQAQFKSVIEEAAVLSGWTSRTRVKENLRFMDEAEALARFCILQYQQSGNRRRVRTTATHSLRVIRP